MRKNNISYIIILNDKNGETLCSRTFRFFVKSAVCAHLVVYFNFNDLHLFGKSFSKRVEPAKKNVNGGRINH